MADSPIPLFVCHANCCRSVLACYLYRHLSGGAPGFSAGLDAGPGINDHALAMLERWGIDARGHQPRQLDRALCDRAGAIFVMGPTYLARLLRDYGADLAARSYLFADPFRRPESFQQHGAYRVCDPSFDDRATEELVRDFGWMQDRVLQIRLALLGDGPRLIPAREYGALVETVDPMGH